MKFILFVILCFHSIIAISQQHHYCSEAKINSLKENFKKTRFNSSDKALMEKYDVFFYSLDLDIEKDTMYIEGNTTIGAKIVSSTTDTFAFELNPTLDIDSIVYNTASLAFVRNSTMTYAIFNTSIPANTDVYIKVFYHGNAADSIYGTKGLIYYPYHPKFPNGITYTSSEPYSSYKWFPCKQFLQDKADSVCVAITTDNSNKVGSNGKLVMVDTLPSNKLKYSWKSHHPIEYYLISAAVAEYSKFVNFAHPAGLINDSIRIEFYYPGSFTSDPYYQYKDSIPKWIESYSSLFGVYPFYDEKYGHCLTTLNGGMENQTMSSIGTGFFYTGMIFHELAHQWFGNNVSCKTWKDIFISEGLATYCELLFMNDNANLISRQNYVLSQSGGSIYFTDTTDVNRIFDNRLSYQKGACIMHTLRFLLGDSIFFQVLKNYQTQFAESNASIEDFKQIATNTSGQDLTDFFNQWIYGEGYPKYSIRYNSTGNHIIFKLSQTTSMPSSVSFFKTPIEIKFYYSGGDTTILFYNYMNDQHVTIPSNRIITNVFVDPNNWLLRTVNMKVKDPGLVADLPIESFKGDIAIYPNPANTIIHVDNIMDEDSKLFIYAMDGRVILDQELSKNKNVVSIKNLASNNYLLSVTVKDKVVMTKKIIKN